MDGDYSIKKLDFSILEDMQRLVNLQNEVYTGKHTFSCNTFKYWYLDNPNGKVISFNAFYGDIIAAHYALIPIKMEIDGKITLGLLSMATVTHPEHRGKGLFKMLAKMAYDYAAKEGFEFVIGVANANSYPGFIKYFDFQDVGQLEVRLGFSNKIESCGEKRFNVYWDDAGLRWRSSRYGYTKDRTTLYGTKKMWIFNKAPFVKTILGKVCAKKLQGVDIDRCNKLLRPLNLYVGIGSNASEIGYVELPKFIKHSPFHLIFMDLTRGKLPTMTKDNVFFQLMDFDVA